MKKYILRLVIPFFILTGCYDLDRSPFDQLSSSTFWKTEAQCKQGLMGVYSTLKSTDLFGKQFLTDINSDIAVGYDQYEALILGTATPTTGFLNGKWQNGYNTIQGANLAIRNIEVSEIDEAVKKMFIGEAKFLRALAYFHLLDYFGGLPIYDETTNLETDINKLDKPRSSADDTRKFIIKDLEDATKAGLPDKWDNENYGRVTKGAAYALLGKVQLYNKEYDKAILSYEEALKPQYGYELHSNFAELFTPAGNGSREAIFSIVNIGNVGQMYGMPFAFYAGTRATRGSCWNNTVPSTGLADMYEYKDGKPFVWDELFPGYTTNNNVKEQVLRCLSSDDGTKILDIPEEAKTIMAMYEQRDPRMKATLIMPYTKYMGWYSNAARNMTFYFAKKADGGIVGLNEANGFIRNNKGGWETYFWRKYVPEGDWDGTATNREHTPVNYSIIRLADLYLQLAECYNEVEQQDKAVEYINKVRERVGMAQINSGPTHLEARTKKEVFDRIFKERAYELANEGFRDSDLRRWNISHTILNKDEFGITGKRLLTRKFNKDRDYLWPIPSDEIEKNKLITQNPGW